MNYRDNYIKLSYQVVGHHKWVKVNHYASFFFNSTLLVPKVAFALDVMITGFRFFLCIYNDLLYLFWYDHTEKKVNFIIKKKNTFYHFGSRYCAQGGGIRNRLNFWGKKIWLSSGSGTLSGILSFGKGK